MPELKPESIVAALRGRNVLVLGGSGVIGSRLVDVLVEEIGAQVAVVVRNLAKAVRIARHPVELIQGDVTDSVLLERAMAGRDVVIDLTFPKEGSFNEKCESARAMARGVGAAVLEQKVPRLVHLSTISAYGPLSGSTLDETAPRRPGADAYGASKLAGEEEMLKLYRAQQVPVVVLQPTVVYGPFTGWTVGPINQLKSGTFVLPEGGSGACNAVYIDDVVQAILRAAVATAVEGEVFLISGDPVPTWREFYGAYEGMLGFDSTCSMSEVEIRTALAARAKAARPASRLMATLRRDAELRQIVLGLPVVAQLYAGLRTFASKDKVEGIKDRILERNRTNPAPQKPLIFPTTVQLGIYVPQTQVSISKAQDELGYLPAYDLQYGMKFARDWAEWARLLD